MDEIIDTHENKNGIIEPVMPNPSSAISVKRGQQGDMSISGTGSGGCFASAVVGVIGSICGTIAEVYAAQLAYEIESKRLDVELHRINRQADAVHKAIDKQFQLKMEELKTRRVALEKFYKTFDNELDRLHIERQTVLQIAHESQKKAFETGFSLEERALFKDLAIESIKQLPLFGDKIHESLQTLIQTIQINRLENQALKKELMENNQV